MPQFLIFIQFLSLRLLSNLNILYPWARYKIDVTSNNAEIHLHLFDEIGTVMEGVSAAIPHLGHDGSILIKPSLEWVSLVSRYARMRHHKTAII